VTALLRAAFAALGHDGDGLERVAGALRASGDAETLALFDGDEHGFDRGYFTVLEIAQSVPESHGFVALDLFTEVCSPGAMRRALERGRLSDENRVELALIDWRGAG
jgi:hypothetical protein